jgi:hypothetical protein
LIAADFKSTTRISEFYQASPMPDDRRKRSKRDALWRNCTLSPHSDVVTDPLFRTGDFSDQYQRLAQLSAAQPYRLRQSRTYRQRLVTYQVTRPTKVTLGERRHQAHMAGPVICD